MEYSTIQKMTGFGCNNVVFVLMFVMIQYIITPVNGSQCHQSLQSVTYVKQCPKNANEWDKRAALKNCASFKQNCVPTDQFMYHCVLNADGTVLLEVCAPFKNIHGKKCAEFDNQGSLIQENSKTCSNDVVPCPAAYKSTDSFEYQSCYDGVGIEVTVEEEENFSFIPKSWIPEKNKLVEYLIYACLVDVFIYVTLSLILYFSLRQKEAENRILRKQIPELMELEIN